MKLSGKNKEDYLKLGQLLQEFEKLDKDLFGNLKSENWVDVIEQTVRAKKEIKRFLSDKSSINVGKELAIKLKMIRDNYGYNIDKVLESLEKSTGERFSQEAEDEIDWMDTLFSKGTADYVDWDFFRRRNEVGSIIGSQSLPDVFLHHLDKLKECYALSLFEATIIFCRSVIEVGVFEALKRKGEIKSDKKVADIGEYRLNNLMRRIKPFVYQGNWEKGQKVIKHANKILHSKRNKIVVSENEAYDSIKDTIAIIEELFQ